MPAVDAGVDHARDRACATGPAGRSARGAPSSPRVLPHEVAGVAAADAGRLHPAVGGEVGRAERDPLHARRGLRDLLHPGHARGGLEDRVDLHRTRQAGAGLELREQPVDVVDVLGARHLRHHDDVEAVADLRHERHQVVERPRRVERVDARPQLRRCRGRAVRATSTRPARAACLLAAGTASSRLPSRTSTSVARAGSFATIFAFDGSKKWIIREGRHGTSRSGSGAPTASGRKKSLGLRTSAG